MATIQEILIASGYEAETFTNRMRSVKGLNSVLNKSDIVIQIAPKGKVWERPSGFKYNCNIYIKGVVRQVFKIAPSTDDKDFVFQVLICMAKFVKTPECAKHIQAVVTEPCVCSKCKGKGIIPAFYYYADGVCFECMGWGFTGKYNYDINIKQ